MVRHGVRLTAHHVFILDAVERSGEDGIEGHALRRMLTANTGRKSVGRALPKAVGDLNERIVSTGWAVKARRATVEGKQLWFYSLDRIGS